MRHLSFKRHRFPPDIIRHAIWLYARFTLSFRDAEEMLAERGVEPSKLRFSAVYLTTPPGRPRTSLWNLGLPRRHGRETAMAPGWVVVEGGQSEPVSVQNSLLNRENTGKFLGIGVF